MMELTSIFIIHYKDRIDKKLALEHQFKKINHDNYHVYEINNMNIDSHFQQYKEQHKNHQKIQTLNEVSYLKNTIELYDFIERKKLDYVIVCNDDICFNDCFYDHLNKITQRVEVDFVSILNPFSNTCKTTTYICNSHFRKNVIKNGLKWFLHNNLTFENGLNKLINDQIIKSNYVMEDVSTSNMDQNKGFVDYGGKNKHFVFIVPSYNNEKWIERNILSIINQNYPFWKMIYINDCSNDKTDEKFHLLTKGNKEKILYIKNTVKYGQAYNRYSAYHMCNDNEICVMLDGDDWLCSNYVLDYVNIFMNIYDVDITYGTFRQFSNNKIGSLGWNPKDYSLKTITNKSYRKDVWRATHLRVLKAEYLKQINPFDFIMENNEFIISSTDMVESFACLELSNGKHKKIEECLVIYNKDNSLLYPSSYFNKELKQLKKDTQKKVCNKAHYKKENTIPKDRLVVIYIDNANYKEELRYYKENMMSNFDLFLSQSNLIHHYDNKVNKYKQVIYSPIRR